MNKAAIMREEEVERLIQERVDTLLLEKGPIPFGVWVNRPENKEYAEKNSPEATLKRYHAQSYPVMRKICTKIVSGILRQIENKIPVVVFHDKLSRDSYPNQMMLETIIELLQEHV